MPEWHIRRNEELKVESASMSSLLASLWVVIEVVLLGIAKVNSKITLMEASGKCVQSDCRAFF